MTENKPIQPLSDRGGRRGVWGTTPVDLRWLNLAERTPAERVEDAAFCSWPRGRRERVSERPQPPFRTCPQAVAPSEEREPAHVQLIQAGKMECIGTLAAGAAHEVKNVLQIILMGLAYVGKNIHAAEENVPSVIGEMREAVHRANGIVQDLIQFSAARQLEMRAEDLNSVIERSLRLVKFGLRRAQISVVLQLAEKLPAVRLDAGRMEQVFVNLCLNAIQAMPQGGALLVTTRTDTDAFSRPLVIVEIQDTGSGIPAVHLSRVFEPYFTTKPEGVGTGLGLAVARQIMEWHGGSIRIENTPPAGAKVSLVFNVQTGTGYAQEANSHCG